MLYIASVTVIDHFNTPSAVFQQLGPITNSTGHVTYVNKVKLLLAVRPLTFHIIDLILEIWRNAVRSQLYYEASDGYRAQIRLYWAQVDSNDLCALSVIIQSSSTLYYLTCWVLVRYGLV